MVTSKTSYPVLPPLDDHWEISAARQNEFREKGHLFVRGLVRPEELTVYRALIRDAVKKSRTEKRKIPENSNLEKIHGNITGNQQGHSPKARFAQVMNLWRINDGLRYFVLARRFAGMAADLLGVDKLRLYHDRVIVKEPGGSSSSWHQDQHYWPIDTPDTVTLVIALVDIGADMGMLSFASGSHKEGSLLDPRITDESDSKFRKYIKTKHFPIVRAAGMQAGDATWHYGNTVHQAGGNESGHILEMMTIVYIADGARITEPRNKVQTHDWKTWLMGLPPGALVSSELNPLVL
ncbi:phytanoyl-CoA dioxygenase family protein [Flavitalea flava]